MKSTVTVRKPLSRRSTKHLQRRWKRRGEQTLPRGFGVEMKKIQLRTVHFTRFDLVDVVG